MSSRMGRLPAEYQSEARHTSCNLEEACRLGLSSSYSYDFPIRQDHDLDRRLGVEQSFQVVKIGTANRLRRRTKFASGQTVETEPKTFHRVFSITSGAKQGPGPEGRAAKLGRGRRSYGSYREEGEGVSTDVFRRLVVHFPVFQTRHSGKLLQGL